MYDERQSNLQSCVCPRRHEVDTWDLSCTVPMVAKGSTRVWSEELVMTDHGSIPLVTNPSLPDCERSDRKKRVW